MVQKLIEKWNGGKKAFFSALLGATVGAIPVAVAVGEYKGKVDTMEKAVEVCSQKLTEHIETYTPNIVAEYHETKADVAVNTERISNLQKSLDEIKEQNRTIIALMRGKR